MRKAMRAGSGMGIRLLTLGLLCGAVWAGGALLGVAAESARAPTEDEVKDLQKQYQAEREAAAKAGLGDKASPDAMRQAARSARAGAAALKAGRLLNAAGAFRRARWQLPYLPPDLPKNVAKVFGSLRLRHAGEVNGLAYNADGSRLATASADGTVKIWDLANGHELLTYRGHGDSVRAVAFSPDGKQVVSGGGEEINLWKAADGKDIRTFKGPKGAKPVKKGEEEEKFYVTSLAFNPDGLTVASAWNGTSVRIYEVATGNLKTTLDTQQEKTTMVQAVAYRPDGKQIGVANSNEVVQIYDTANGTLLLGFQSGNSSVNHITFSADNKFFAICGSRGAGIYKVPVAGAFNSNQPVQLFAAEGDNKSSRRVAFSKDGKTLAIASEDNLVRLYDVDSKDSVATFQGHTDEIKGLAFSSVANELASASADHTVRLWHFANVAQARTLEGHKGAVWSAAFSPNGKKVVSGGADKTVKIWEAASVKDEKTLTGHKRAVTTVLYSPNGKYILSCGGDKVLKLWDADSGDLVRTLEGHDSAVTAAAFSLDSKQIVSGAADRLVKIWNVDTGKEVNTLKDNKAVVAAVAFSPDGKQVASGGVDQVVTLWNAKTGKVSASWNAHGAAVSCVAYSPNGEWLASSGADQLVKVWKTTNPGAVPITLRGHTGPVSSVAFSSDNRTLVSGGSDQLVKIWQLEGAAGKEVRQFRGHKDWISSVAFSKDGHYVVSASVDKTVKIWELASPEVTTSSDQAGDITAVAMSPDGKYLASGASDHSIKIWDAKTGAELHRLLGHGDAITALLFTPDSKTLVSASLDNSLKLWDPVAGKEQVLSDDQRKGFSLNTRVPAMGITPDGKTLFLWLPGSNDKSATKVMAIELATGKDLEYAVSDQGRFVNCLAFSADGKLAAMGAKDGSVRIYTVAKKGEVEVGGDRAVHQNGVGDLIFTPDGKTLITGDTGSDKKPESEIKIWSVANKKEPLHTIKAAHKQSVVAFAMSPDGKQFASTSSDNTVKVWEVATGKLVRAWKINYPVLSASYFIKNLTFSNDGKFVVTANADTTLYKLEVPVKE